MKILFAIKNMKNAKGGAEKVLSIVVNGLAKKGYEVTLLTFDERGLDTFYKIDENVKRISLGIGQSGKQANVRETIARMRAMRKIVQVRQPDIVVPFMHSMFIPMAFSLIGMKTKILASEHTVPMHYKHRRLEYVLLICSFFFVHRMTVLSESAKRLYPRIIRHRMLVIPNPVYIYEREVQQFDQNSVRKIILNVGRLSEEKDQKALIRAFAKISDKYPEWDIRIVGEGEHECFLQELIHRHKLSTRVHLVGTTENVSREYKQAQIFAMPSRYESFGLATAEAMSFGIPAIGFKTCVGTNEIIINNKNGILVDRHDKKRVDNFAKGLEKLMKDDALRKKLGEQARQDIVKFQPNIIVNRWEKLIKKIVN